MTWQPIETAPKDESVLLLMDDEVFSGFYSDGGFWVFPYAGYHGCGCCGDTNDQPTHWMPLPELPTQGES